MRSLVAIFRGLFSIEWPLVVINKDIHVMINLVIQGGVREIT